MTPQIEAYVRSRRVAVFAPILLAIAQVLDPPEPRFAQWLASLLLGALNIEQSKFLNWQDLTTPYRKSS